MAEGGSVKARLAKLDAEIAEEMEIWKDHELPPPDMIWNFGQMQLHMSLRLDTIVQVIEQELGVSQDTMDLIYKKKRLDFLREMRPAVIEQRAEAQRNQILDGIFFKPPPDISPN